MLKAEVVYVHYLFKLLICKTIFREKNEKQTEEKGEYNQPKKFKQEIMHEKESFVILCASVHTLLF